MIAEILIFIITLGCGYLVYGNWKNQRYFRKRGVKFVPGWPLFGNGIKGLLTKQHVVFDIDDVYKAFPDERYVGYFEGSSRAVLIRDPDVIKLITVKAFDTFTDHRHLLQDDLLNSSLFMLQGDKWRDMRATLSPAFTGSKMRNMVPFITDIGQNTVEYLKETEGQNIDLADIVRRYTNDVIASTAFGLQVNSLKDPGNDFYKTGQKLMNFTALEKIKMFVLISFSYLRKRVDVFPKESKDFFRNIVKTTMSHREKNNVERCDMIQLLMEASKGTDLTFTGTLKVKRNVEDNLDNVGFATTEEVEVKRVGEAIRHWTQDELTAQAFLFFFAAFESSASVMVMALHELALHGEIQAKLFEEVKAYHDKHGKLIYEGIQELKYLDCVLNETLRKWSAAIILDRVCQKPFTLPPPRQGGHPLNLEPGQVVLIVVSSLHMDAKYYPEPKKFIPERFSDENRHKIVPGTFIPFGSGPRNCIGSRLALLELKILLYLVTLNFEVLKCEKTSDPIRLNPKEFNIRAEGGSWVKFRARN